MTTHQTPASTGANGTQTPRTQRAYAQPKHAWAIVTRREIIAKLTDKAFLVGTFASLAILVIATLVGTLVGNSGTQAKVGVLDQEATAVVKATDKTARAQNDKNAFEAVGVPDEKDGRDKVASGDIDALLLKTDQGWQLVFHKKSNPDITGPVQQTLATLTTAQLAQQAGVGQAELARMSTLQTALVDGSDDKGMLAILAGGVFGILFFMSALTFGMQIATSVVEEKASRIVEIISAAIPVRHLLAGKVLGNTIMAFAQMALLTVGALVAVTFTPFNDMLPSLSGAVVWFLLYFIAGFLALACVWAVAGSLAARNEDLQQTTMPLTMVLMAAYMAGFVARGTWAVVLSYVPVISSVLMPARVVAGEVAPWQVVLGLVINLAFAAVTVLVGEKLYRRSLLQTQGTLTYRQAFQLKD